MPLRKSILILSCHLAAATCGGTLALAAEEDVEEISVVGSRGHERSAADLAVPVDVLDSSELLRQGDSRMESMLSRIVPSLNVNQEQISDEATLVRPASLRGLPPDSTLVLVNGKRRHRSSVITFVGWGLNDGSHGADLSSIPAIALDRVEVLRDGAAAQYGSDAVAGILNFVLKDAAEGGSLDARWGQYYYGDGESVTVSGNMGLPLTDNGFLNLSAEFNEVDPTSRSVQRDDAQTLIMAGNTDVRAPKAQIWGAPDIKDNYKLFGNAAIDLGDSHEVYAFGNYSERTTEGGFFFRHPHNRDGVFAYPDELLDLVNKKLEREGSEPLPAQKVLVIHHKNPETTGPQDGVRYSDQEIEAAEQALMNGTYMDNNANCPDINIVDGVINQEDLRAVNTAEDCFAFNEPFPGGFTPQFGGDIEDTSIALGFRGELPWRLTYDASAVFGRHEVEFFMKNTINPQLASMGVNIPTDYKPGSFIETDQIFNLDFTKQFDIEAFHSPLNVGFGFEYREEEYETEPGGKNSWFIDYLSKSGTEQDPVYEEYDEPDLLAISCDEYRDFLDEIEAGNVVPKYPTLGVGSNGFQGFRPDPCDPANGKHDRSSVAAYVDFEADVTQDLFLGVAFRHEDAEEFESTLDGKISARFQATDTMALRGSFSTGFRVPTVGQTKILKSSTNLEGNKLVDELTVPATHPLLTGIAEPLEAEESVSVGFGTVFSVGSLDVTVDYYHIEVKDRIATTSKKHRDCLLLQRARLGTSCGFASGDDIQGDTTGKLKELEYNLAFDSDEDRPEGVTSATRGSDVPGTGKTVQEIINEEIEALRSDVPAIDTLVQAKWFANDFDTTTEGIDVVATYPMELFGGLTQFTLTGNYNRTTIDERNTDTIGNVRKHQIEEGRPKIRLTLTADHQAGPWRLLSRVRYYSSHIEYHLNEPSLFLRADARFLMDLEATYNFTDQFSLVVGAENLLDEEPTVNPYDSIAGAEYPLFVPFDSNGGFYYLKAVARF